MIEKASGKGYGNTTKRSKEEEIRNAGQAGHEKGSLANKVDAARLGGSAVAVRTVREERRRQERALGGYEKVRGY